MATELLTRTDDDRPALAGARCDRCARPHFPATEDCPWCGADGCRPEPLPTRGTLLAWTAVTAPPPGCAGEVPYGFGVVQLGDELRVVTRLTEADLSRLRHGQPMELVTVEVPTDDGPLEVWAFRPEART